MAEAITVVPGTAGLHERTAAVALRVADVIEACAADSPGADQAAGFLRAWADSVPYPPPGGDDAFGRTAAGFGLSSPECDLLVLAGLPDEHEGIATTLRSMHPQSEPRPTVGLAALLIGGADGRRAVRSLLTDGAAARNHLLLVSGRTTYFERSLQLPDGMWETWHGDDGWPADLSRVPMGPPPPGLGGWLTRPEVAAARRRGPPGCAGDRADRPMRTRGSPAPVQPLSRRPRDARRSRRGWPPPTTRGRPSWAHRPWRGGRHRSWSPSPHPKSRLASWLSRTSPARSSCAPRRGPCGRPATEPCWLLPTGLVAVRDQREAWSRAVPQLAGSAAAIAARHPMDPAVTAALTADAQAHVGSLDLAGVSRLVRARAAASMPAGATLTTPSVPWSQVVLPAQGALQLRDAVARLDHQDVVLDDWGLREQCARDAAGPGCCFTGPPGTGKSLAAAAVATAAQTDLLVVDVSRIVSKWLGETEKNLAGVFDAAERTQAVLLLDEADALFGTRTEISDAHDRYANLETAYLLQRLDRFEGLVILTTNLRDNIDAAFLRRVDFVVEFPLPDEPSGASCGRCTCRPSRWTTTWTCLHWPGSTPSPAPGSATRAVGGLHRCVDRRPDRPGPSRVGDASRVREGRTAVPRRTSEETAMTPSESATTTTSSGAPCKGAPCKGTAGAPCTCEGGTSEDLAVNPFVDLRVAYGMLLGADEFRVLMGNPRGKQMLHNAWLHGSGVVWGYPVSCADDQMLTIGPGLALDGIGRELMNRTTECDDLYQMARELIESGPPKKQRGHEGCCHDEEPPRKQRTDCESWSVHACLVATFDTCLTAAVPTVQDPCDVTRKHDDWSRVVERVRFELLPGCCCASCCGYHRVRVLLGLEAVGADDEAGAQAAAARRGVAELPAAERAEALDRELRRMAMLDSLERRPEGDPGPCEVSLFPVDEDNSSVPLACVRFTVVERDGCTMIEDVCVDCSVRTTLLPTCLVQDLTAGLAPGLLGDEDLPSTDGPQVIGERVTVEASGRRIVLPVTAPLMASSVHGSARVHTLSGRRSDGWERQTIENTRYDPKRQAIVVRLVDRLADELVRVVVSGSGDRPVMGLDPLVPLEGVVGDRPQSRFDGIDAVWTFVYEPPEPESDDVEVVEIDIVEVDVVEPDDEDDDTDDDDTDDDDSAEEVQA